ncbi:glycoside hydrolase family 108 protein [Cupriavidus metallidurans]|uniref:Uncharacterized protein n=1 Tax=Cupriavidus metallidurans TaxID=119219 RepID=A0A482IQP0_9BURK|nr:glycosyl hydrolase 108 family protein [Cupriavidus metallidurans]QBP09837.1 hypothetical protein DDF84_008720 [Cupriavidus metallidurans]
MSAFEQAFAKLLGIEGGYSNHKNDTGGATRYGITEAVARAEGYTGPMPQLPVDMAKAIYRRRYWDLLRLDDVAKLCPAISDKMFDIAVNMGTSIAGTFLQRSLNVLNRQGVDYADVIADGVVGPRSINALCAYFARRGEKAAPVLLKALNSLQGARYIELAERRPANEDFVFGWLDNRVGV